MYKNILLIHGRTCYLLHLLLLRNGFLHCLIHGLFLWLSCFFWPPGTVICPVELARMRMSLCIIPMLFSINSHEVDCLEVKMEAVLVQASEAGGQPSGLVSSRPGHCPAPTAACKVSGAGNAVDKKGSGGRGFWSPRRLDQSCQGLYKILWLAR